MSAKQFIDRLPPMHREFYIALSKLEIEHPVKFAQDYRVLWFMSGGSVDESTMDAIIDNLRIMSIPEYLLCALDNHTLHGLLISYNAVIHEQIVAESWR